MGDEAAASRLVLIGAGGHGKVVLEALRAMGKGWKVAGFVDAAPPAPGVLGTPVLGDESVLPRLRAQGVAAAVVALGDNHARQRVGERVRALGFALASVLHPAALVAPSARIGPGAMVLARAVIGTETCIGPLAIVNTGAILDHENEVEEAAHVAPGCALAGLVRVGARALVGVGSAVRPGIRIGPDAVIGAGSAVVSDVAPGAVVGGAPARPLRSGAPRPGWGRSQRGG